MAKILNGELDITSLLRSYELLTRGLSEAKSELERAGAIQAFECSYELAWKTMKRILNYRGVEVNSPRDSFREAAKIGIIADAQLWFDILKKRNQTVHIYDEQVAIEVFESLPKFASLLNQFISTIKKL